MAREKVEVNIKFDLTKMSKEQKKHLMDAQRSLNKAGVRFDTGGNSSIFDWEFDWSLKGPVVVTRRVDEV